MTCINEDLSDEVFKIINFSLYLEKRGHRVNELKHELFPLTKRWGELKMIRRPISILLEIKSFSMFSEFPSVTVKTMPGYFDLNLSRTSTKLSSFQ